MFARSKGASFRWPCKANETQLGRGCRSMNGNRQTFEGRTRLDLLAVLADVALSESVGRDNVKKALARAAVFVSVESQHGRTASMVSAHAYSWSSKRTAVASSVRFRKQVRRTPHAGSQQHAGLQPPNAMHTHASRTPQKKHPSRTQSMATAPPWGGAVHILLRTAAGHKLCCVLMVWWRGRPAAHVQ